MTKAQMLRWAMDHPALAAYLADSADMVGYLALKGVFLNEEYNRGVLMNCHVKAHDLFNEYIDTLEAALGLADDDDAKNDYLVNMSYPVDLMEKTFETLMSKYEIGDAVVPSPDDYTSTCDPQWWTFRTIDGYIKSCEIVGLKPFCLED